MEQADNKPIIHIHLDQQVTIEAVRGHEEVEDAAVAIEITGFDVEEDLYVLRGALTFTGFLRQEEESAGEELPDAYDDRDVFATDEAVADAPVIPFHHRLPFVLQVPVAAQAQHQRENGILNVNPKIGQWNVHVLGEQTVHVRTELIIQGLDGAEGYVFRCGTQEEGGSISKLDQLLEQEEDRPFVTQASESEAVFEPPFEPAWSVEQEARQRLEEQAAPEDDWFIESPVARQQSEQQDEEAEIIFTPDPNLVFPMPEAGSAWARHLDETDRAFDGHVPYLQSEVEPLGYKPLQPFPLNFGQVPQTSHQAFHFQRHAQPPVDERTEYVDDEDAFVLEEASDETDDPVYDDRDETHSMAQYSAGEASLSPQIPANASEHHSAPQFRVEDGLPTTPQFRVKEEPPSAPQFRAEEELPSAPQFRAEEELPSAPQFRAEEELPSAPHSNLDAAEDRVEEPVEIDTRDEPGLTPSEAVEVPLALETERPVQAEYEFEDEVQHDVEVIETLGEAIEVVEPPLTKPTGPKLSVGSKPSVPVATEAGMKFSSLLGESRTQSAERESSSHLHESSSSLHNKGAESASHSHTHHHSAQEAHVHHDQQTNDAHIHHDTHSYQESSSHDEIEHHESSSHLAEGAPMLLSAKGHTQDSESIWGDLLLEQRETQVTMKFRIVQHEDSLTALAERYNTSVNELLRANNLQQQQVDAGQILYIPTKRR